MATPNQVIAKARSQVGTREAGYSNQVAYNDWFWGKGKYGSWAAWCSVFLCWCSDQFGMRRDIDYPHSAGVAVCFAWFTRKGRRVSKKKLQPGDWVRFTFSHTALFLGYANKAKTAITTIEGNTSPGNSGSQRDGGGVWKRTRPLSLIQYGGRPNYTHTTPAKPGGEETDMQRIGKGVRTKDIVLRPGKRVRITANDNGVMRLGNTKKGQVIDGLATFDLKGLLASEHVGVNVCIAYYDSKAKKTTIKHRYPGINVPGIGNGQTARATYPWKDGKCGYEGHGSTASTMQLEFHNTTNHDVTLSYLRYEVLGS